MKLLKRGCYLICTVFLLTLITTASVGAQVSGTVYDAVSGDPLIAASVLVQGSTVGTVTDIEGRYRLNNLPQGPQVLQFSYIGYASDSLPVTINPGAPVELDIRLSPAGFMGETIIVTSQRQGQNAAINQQVNANTIVNVVSQERIRELPDENAAESVGRLPGVGVSRSGGEGQRVNIRGLSPKFSAVALDGVTIPPTGQGRSIFNLSTRAGGGSNPSVDDRSVDLSMISSEALAGIEVYKSLTPDQDGDAIGGRINFVSARAPSTPKYYANVLGGYNFYHQSYDNFKANFSTSRRLWNDKVGIIATGGFNTIDRSSDSYNTEYIVKGSRLLNGLDLNDNMVQRRRYNASLGLDYELGNGHDLFLSGLYGRTSIDSENRSVSYSIQSTEANIGAGVGQSEIDLVNVSLTGRHPFQALALDWKGTFVQTTDMGGPGYGYGFRDINPFAGEPIPEQDPFLANRIYRYDPTILGGGIGGGGGFTERIDRNYIGQVNARRDINLGDLNLSGFLKTGFKVQIKNRTRQSDGGNLTLPGAAVPDAYAAAYPDAPFVRNREVGGLPFVEQDNNLTGFFDGQFPILVSIDPSRAEQLFRQFEFLRLPLINQGVSDYDVSERIYAGYFMADVNIGKRFNLVGGLRYEYSDNDYGAFQRIDYGEFVDGTEAQQTGTLRYATSSQQYGELLPMLNMKYNLVRNNDNANGIDVRLAVTKALTRPDFYNLTPYVLINNSSNVIQRSDPNLRHTTAWNYDLFLTFYSGKYGLFTLGGFYKELSDVELIYGRQEVAEIVRERFFDEFGLETAFNIVEPINAPEVVRVRGGELEVQTNLAWLPSPFDGVVLYGNVSLINSSTNYPQRIVDFNFDTFETETIDTTRAGTLPGQANTIANLSLGYDKGRFSGRLSYNYQGDNLGFLAASELLDNYTGSFTRVDFSATLKITDQLSLQTNVNNILNQFDNSFIGVDRRDGGASIFGTVAWLGLRWSASGPQN